MTAVIVLGMHRSGTSCVAAMLAAGGAASAGEAARNWDNARGHHEMLDLVRLDEAVLAASGGHWLARPREVRWTEAHAAERDRLLRARPDGRPALLKDPRALLVLPFWRASRAPFRAIGVVRHPLAVARSLEAWRGMPLAEGVALWTAHNRALAEAECAILDFDRPRDELLAALVAACGGAVDLAAMAAAYAPDLVHHDAEDPIDVPGLDEAMALHRRLVGDAPARARARFPRAALAAAAQRLEAGDEAGAIAAARAALVSVDDAAAVLVPVAQAFARRGAVTAARALVEAHAARIDRDLADLLLGKLLLAAGEADAAARHLEAACAAPRPLAQARLLLPHALRAAGRDGEARAALDAALREALYPHGPLSTGAEWHWADGDRAAALASMARAIDAAPPHRRGRLRTRRAEWLLATGDDGAARGELARAIDEDPAYPRSRDLLRRLVAPVAAAVLALAPAAARANRVDDALLHDRSSATVTFLFGTRSTGLDLAFRIFGFELGGSFQDSYEEPGADPELDPPARANSQALLVGASPFTLGSWWWGHGTIADLAYAQPFVQFKGAQVNDPDGEHRDVSWVIGTRAWAGMAIVRLGVQVEVEAGASSEFNRWSAGFFLGTGNPLPEEEGEEHRDGIHVLTTLGGFAGLVAVAAIVGALSSECTEGCSD